jgi:hypothetical protein
MLNNDWKVYRRNQRMRRIAQEQAAPDLYAPRPALRSDDAIETEIEAMKAEERRVIDRANEEVVQSFANAVNSPGRRAA